MEEEAPDVRAQAGRGAWVQHVVAALLPMDHLVQPRTERDAGHLRVGALQVGSWQGRRKQADPAEVPAWPHPELGGFGQIP